MKKITRKKIVRKESSEQAEFITRARAYLKLHGFDERIIFAIPNGGSRHILEAVSLKRQGVVPGVPDIFFAASSFLYHGLFIEMKRSKGGKLSPDQKIMIDILRDRGYCVRVCAGADDAMNALREYIEGGNG